MLLFHVSSQSVSCILDYVAVINKKKNTADDQNAIFMFFNYFSEHCQKCGSHFGGCFFFFVLTFKCAVAQTVRGAKQKLNINAEVEFSLKKQKTLQDLGNVGSHWAGIQMYRGKFRNLKEKKKHLLIIHSFCRLWNAHPETVCQNAKTPSASAFMFFIPALTIFSVIRIWSFPAVKYP